MPRPKSFLNTLYERDPSSKRYVISVRVNHYRDLFNDLDPSPLRRRDLDNDFIGYLDDSSLDIPLSFGTLLRIHAPESIRDPANEERVRAGVKTYYSFLHHTSMRRLRSSLRQVAIYVAIAVMALFAAFYLGARLPDNFLSRTLVEGFYIGGWVFFWEALVLLAIKNRETRVHGKRLRRIVQSPVEFWYEKHQRPPGH